MPVPFKPSVLAPLGTLTLGTRIREFTWSIDDEVRQFNAALRDILKHIKKLNAQNIQTAFPAVKEHIFAEIDKLRSWLVHLKKISFYDATVLYIYTHYTLSLHRHAAAEEKKITRLRKRAKDKKEQAMLEAQLKSVEGADREVTQFRRTLLQKLIDRKDKANKKVRNGFTWSAFLAQFVKEPYFTRRIRTGSRKIKSLDMKRRPLQNVDLEKSPEKVHDLIAIYKKVLAHIQKIMAKDTLSFVKLKQHEKKLRRAIENVRQVVAQGGDTRFTAALFADIDVALQQLDTSVDDSLREIALNNLRQLNRAS